MQPQSDAEKELLKENLYLNRIQEILRKSRGYLQEAVTAEASAQYSTETTIIDRVIVNERNAFISGIVLSGLVFTSVRFGPRFIVTKLNPEKGKMLKKADDIAEKAGTRWMQKTFSFLFELSFGAWAGWRGYSILSSQNNQSYDEIAKIPLCAGRSRVSDKVCLFAGLILSIISIKLNSTHKVKLGENDIPVESFDVYVSFVVI